MYLKPIYAALVGTALAVNATSGLASSHMDAPLITYDDPANTTDVYAFRSGSADGKRQFLTTALAVYPFEEPGIGPNNYSFDPRVIYQLHVALDDDVASGQKTLSYRFEFESNYRDENTILQAYVDEVSTSRASLAGRNLVQRYRVTRIDHRNGSEVILGKGIVPPNNQGLVTPFYNRDDDGDAPAKAGVSRTRDLDAYTRNGIFELRRGYRAFAGQRDDGFYADIQSIFDLDFSFGANTGSDTKPFDSQAGFNVHTIVLNIPLRELDGAKIAGVYATTSRSMRSKRGRIEWQVGRQGNPLFAEGFIAIKDKDYYNQSSPNIDESSFTVYAESPELADVLNVQELIPGLLRGIFIPDLIKVDLTTGPARLAGEDGFHRLSVFGLDVLQSKVQDPFGTGQNLVPGGWPNGRRFGDDVLDIGLIALGAAGQGGVPAVLAGKFANVDIDGVTDNDITYNDVFPYAATPLNGRNHGHERSESEQRELAYEE